MRISLLRGVYKLIPTNKVAEHLILDIYGRVRISWDFCTMEAPYSGHPDTTGRGFEGYVQAPVCTVQY